MSIDQLDSIEAVETAMRAYNYICDRPLATVIFLSLKLGKPILLEGEAGVGKTEVAKVLAALLGDRLIRLQCYEGLDVNTALYEWNFPKQMLHIKIAEATEDTRRELLECEIFSPDYLIKRPLLEAIQGGEQERLVLLIDEVDRSDEEFEAFLLEILSDFQISIPEIGTLRALYPPVVILTSNRTRDIHDALKRRCLFHWIDFPSFEKEYDIVRIKVPGIDDDLAKEVCHFIASMREQDFFKRPGVAETLDWSRALLSLGRSRLDINCACCRPTTQKRGVAQCVVFRQREMNNLEIRWCRDAHERKDKGFDVGKRLQSRECWKTPYRTALHHDACIACHDLSRSLGDPGMHVLDRKPAHVAADIEQAQ